MQEWLPGGNIKLGFPCQSDMAFPQRRPTCGFWKYGSICNWQIVQYFDSANTAHRASNPFTHVSFPAAGLDVIFQPSRNQERQDSGVRAADLARNPSSHSTLESDRVGTFYFCNLPRSAFLFRSLPILCVRNRSRNLPLRRRNALTLGKQLHLLCNKILLRRNTIQAM